MAEAQSGIFDLTVPVILAHPHLTEAVAFKRNGKETGEKKYSVSFVFAADNPDLKGLKEKAVSIAKAKWPGRDLGAEHKAGNFKFFWTPGDKLADKYVAKKKAAGKEDDGKSDFQRGKVVVKSSSKFAPRLAILSNGKIIDLDESNLAAHKAKFYFGVQALAQFNIVPYDGVGEDGKDGVTAYINLVLSLNKGERLSGGASAVEVFKGYAGSMSGEDPGSNEVMNDDIPF